MQHLQDFPDLGLSFAKLKLQDAIAENKNDHPIAQIWAANAYTNYGAVIKEIAEQMADQMDVVEDLIGFEAAGLFHQAFPVVRRQYRARRLTQQIDIC